MKESRLPNGPEWRGLVPRAAVILTSAALGCLLPVQARLNGELAQRWSSGIAPAFLNFASGWLIVTALLMGSRVGRAGVWRLASALRRGSISRWVLGAGALGSVLQVAQGFGVHVVGVALLTVAVVAGQAVGGLLVDARGLLGVRARRASRRRIVGTLLVVVATAGAAAPRALGSNDPGLATAVAAGCVFAGLCAGVQQATNAAVSRESGSALTATWVNFSAGVVVLAPITAAAAVVSTGWSIRPVPPWLCLGGGIGVIFVLGAAVLVRRSGVLLFSLSMTSGQLGASLALDLLVPSASPAGWVDASVVLTVLMAVLLIAEPDRSARVIAPTCSR